MKWLIKLFMPSAESIAELAAERIADAVNTSESETQVKIGRISSVANEAAVVVAKLGEMAKDGQISKTETADLAKILLPFASRIVELIK